MTTRIGTGGPVTGVSTTASAARVTAPSGQPFRAMMGAGASAILSGAEQAVTRLPGGPILAAALRPTVSGGDLSAAGHTPATATVRGAGASTPEGGAGTAGVGLGGGAAGAPTGADGSIEASLNQTANQNLYFLELQERMSAESRNYSAISNVLKARHDTVKNAIGNIR
ncbi:MAG: hypothetical protein EOO73_28955 [Myxococcales bacterium]|nr:MAG: hypothetical protein EOO73_28955 [Myxococcales bacterium]